MGQKGVKPQHPKLRLKSTDPDEGQTEDGLPRSARKDGRFVIPWRHEKPKISFMKYLREPDHSNIPSKQGLDETLPILTPDHDRLATPPQSGVRATWIGHASVLVQIDGVTVLTDPIFSSRCSPVQIAGPKRYRDPPCTIKDLPKIDAIVISHNHYDHLDYGSVKALNARFGDKLHWFVPLGLAAWFHNNGVESVTELDWWEESVLPEHPDVKFVFTPAHHWCKRTLTDDNKVLWGSWCVLGPSSRFHFAGDTAYCEVFKQIGQKYGPFDLSAIPIGAYEPRWFMASMHVDPKEAVQLHQDLQSKKSLGIHWGTFKLAKEFYLEPKEQLPELMREQGLAEDDFFTLKHGETISYGEK